MDDNEQIEHLKRELERAISRNDSLLEEFKSAVEREVEWKHGKLKDLLASLDSDLRASRNQAAADAALAATVAETTRQWAGGVALGVAIETCNTIPGWIYVEEDGSRIMMRLDGDRFREFSIAGCWQGGSISEDEISAMDWIPLVYVGVDCNPTQFRRSLGVAIALNAELLGF